VRGEFGSPGDHTVAFWMRALTLHQAHVCSHPNPKLVADDQNLWFFSTISSVNNSLASSSICLSFYCQNGHTFVHTCEALHFLDSLEREKFHPVFAALNLSFLLSFGRVTKKVLLATCITEFAIGIS
jgi:hypothetical protein